jgi:allantoicase
MKQICDWVKGFHFKNARHCQIDWKVVVAAVISVVRDFQVATSFNSG